MQPHELCHILTCRCPCKGFLARKMVSVGVIGKKDATDLTYLLFKSQFRKCLCTVLEAQAENSLER